MRVAPVNSESYGPGKFVSFAIDLRYLHRQTNSLNASSRPTREIRYSLAVTPVCDRIRTDRANHRPHRRVVDILI